MSHKYIRPNMLLTIMEMVTTAITADQMSKPRRRKVTTNTAAIQMSRFCQV